MAAFAGSTHVSPAERAAFNGIVDAGFADVVRGYTPGEFTYWDYKQLRFARREGMRIDFVLASPALAERVTGAAIDRQERKGKGASDHAPGDRGARRLTEPGSAATPFRARGPSVKATDLRGGPRRTTEEDRLHLHDAGRDERVRVERVGEAAGGLEVAVEPDRRQERQPHDHADHAGDHDQRARDAVRVLGESASAALLTGARASPMPRPTRTRTRVAAPGPTDWRSTATWPASPRRRARARSRRRGRHRVVQRPATEEGTDRDGEQETDEHERRTGRVIRVGEPREDRDVDDHGHQRRADEQADDERTHARGPADAARDQGSAARRCHQRRTASASAPTGRRHRPERPDDLLLGSDDAKVSTRLPRATATRSAPKRSDPPQHRPPPGSRDGREEEEQHEGDHPDRGEDRRVPDEGHKGHAEVTPVTRASGLASASDSRGRGRAPRAPDHPRRERKARPASACATHSAGSVRAGGGGRRAARGRG